MKKLVFSLGLSFFSLFATAQTTYEKVMTEKVENLNKSHSMEELTALANDFERIATKEKTQWLPLYYTALAHLQKGRMLMQSGKVEALDEIADTAEKHLAQAELLEKDNSEIVLLKKMATSLKMMVNPQQRYMSFGMKADGLLKLAEKLNPNNPRVALIKAEDIYFTPEQFGGSKTKGIELFKTALKLYESFPAKSFEPNWGKAEAEYFIGQTK